jgi:hypothetical protein
MVEDTRNNFKPDALPYFVFCINMWHGIKSLFLFTTSSTQILPSSMNSFYLYFVCHTLSLDCLFSGRWCSHNKLNYYYHHVQTPNKNYPPLPIKRANSKKFSFHITVDEFLHEKENLFLSARVLILIKFIYSSHFIY